MTEIHLRLVWLRVSFKSFAFELNNSSFLELFHYNMVGYEVVSSTTGADVIQMAIDKMGLETEARDYKLFLRDFETEPWRTMGSQEGSGGGTFKMRGSGQK